jgi:hypothetical protein
MLSRVGVTTDGFELVKRFIGHLQVVTANNYYITADLHTTNHSTLDILSLLPLVFVTALNNGYSSTMFLLSVSCQRILTQEL